MNYIEKILNYDFNASNSYRWNKTLPNGKSKIEHYSTLEDLINKITNNNLCTIICTSKASPIFYFCPTFKSLLHSYTDELNKIGTLNESPIFLTAKNLSDDVYVICGDAMSKISIDTSI